MSVINWKKFGLTDDIDPMCMWDYVVGIDFGHRKTSAHYVKLEWAADGTPILKTPEKANILDGEKSVISTQFSRDENGIKLGSINGNAYKFFKKNPIELNEGVRYAFDGDISCRELVRDYIGQVIENINSNIEGLNKNSGVLYIIGCPSGGEWLEDGNDVAYAEILKEKAGEDEYRYRTVIVMHESRAALIKLKKEKNIYPQCGEGILVFDFGSVTSDWTLMYLDSEGNPGMIDGSENLGASLIDEKLLEVALGELGRKYSDLMFPAKALDDTVRAKENGYDNFDDKAFCDNTVTYALKDGNYLVKNILPSYLSEITGKTVTGYNSIDGRVSGTWEELCRRFVESVRSEINFRASETKIKSIVLTGGASKMPFIGKICEETFGTEIIMDTHPALSVSKGLVYAGLADIASYESLKETDEKINRLLDFGDSQGYGFGNDAATSLASRIVGTWGFLNEVYGDTLSYWESEEIEDFSEESTPGYFVNLVCKKAEEYIRGSEKIKSCKNELIYCCNEYIESYTANAFGILNKDVEDNLGVSVCAAVKTGAASQTLLPAVELLWNAVSEKDFSDVWKNGVKEMFKDEYDGSMPDMDITLSAAGRYSVARGYHLGYSYRPQWVMKELERAFASALREMAEMKKLEQELKRYIVGNIDRAVNNLIFHL